MKIFTYLFLFCLVTSSFLSNNQAYSNQPTVLQNIEKAPPHVLVIFGASGDLTKRKLIPALVNLQRKGQLPEEFICVGISRKELSHTQFREDISAFISKEDREIWDSLSKKMFYMAGSAENEATYKKLNLLLEQFDRENQTQGNRLYYLATPPSSFSIIIKQLHDNHLVIQTPKNWSRIIIEKPFGFDLDSAIDLQKEISRYLEDNQLYRIDHYLGKEVIHDLLTLRFTNPVLENLWNNQHIDNVSITLSEDIGVGIRGASFEQMGLLRDIVQNHLMQIVSLIGMERPANFETEEIRKEKVRLIESVRPFPLNHLECSIIRGQYGSGVVGGINVPGYRQEEGVAPNSSVETFVAAKLFIDNPRWSDVPFFINAGKRLSKKLTEVVITFKSEENASGLELSPNQLVLRIQPEEEIYFLINTLVPGTNTIKPHKLSLSLHKDYGKTIPEAYERLFKDAMLGDSSHYVGFEEHLASWRLYSPVLKYWEQNPPSNFPNYSAGSDGPEQIPFNP